MQFFFLSSGYRKKFLLKVNISNDKTLMFRTWGDGSNFQGTRLVKIDRILRKYVKKSTYEYFEMIFNNIFKVVKFRCYFKNFYFIE